jgi:hypothetical protein
MASGQSDGHKKHKKRIPMTKHEDVCCGESSSTDLVMDSNQCHCADRNEHAQQTLTVGNSKCSGQYRQVQSSGILMQRHSTKVVCSDASNNTNGHVTDEADSTVQQSDSSQNSSYQTGVGSWLKWLDEPEFMIPEGYCIQQSTNSDSVLAEISESMV